MKKSQARGYLLEDVLERLLKVNGYEIINIDNEEYIKKRGNGLNVLGRGGYHQVDSLGKLRYELPFMYPIRLFVEAKYFSSKSVGIDIVRQGIGLLSDINSNYKSISLAGKPLKVSPYNYQYVIFSASGFTQEARLLALAHKIFLVDLNDEDYVELKQFIKMIVDALFFCSGNGEDISIEIFNCFRVKFQMLLNDYVEFDCILEKFFGCLNRDVNDQLKIMDWQEIKEKYKDFKKSFKSKSIYFVSDQDGYTYCMVSHNDLKFKEYLTENPNSKAKLRFEEKSKKLKKGSKNNQTDYFRIEILENRDILLSITVPLNHKINRNLSFIAYLNEVYPTICILDIVDNKD